MNMRASSLSAVLLPALLTACVAVPLTPAEHREAARSGKKILTAQYTSETLEVRRPFTEVARNFEKKAAECLRGSMTSVTRPNIGFGQTTNVYGQLKPTVLVSPQRAELHFQAKFKGEVGKTPDDGAYFVVADASPVARDRTKVDIYWITTADLVARAVRGWATGETQGCPDMTKVFPA
jgi:hypothetical protein